MPENRVGSTGRTFRLGNRPNKLLRSRKRRAGGPGIFGCAGARRRRGGLIVSWGPRVASTGGIGLLALLAPFAAAEAQNLDAGKSAAQIFAEACSGCHRSPREVRGNASASFLREHYTTGGDMASTMAAYLAGSGADPRGPGAAQPKQKSATPATATRDPPETVRRPQQPEPKAAPATA